MQDVLRSHSLSQALSIKAALELEGIKAVLFNEHALGYMNLAGEIRVMVPDVDRDRAHAVIAKLEAPPLVKQPITRAWRWERRGLRLLGLAVGLSVIRAMASDYVPRLLSARLFVAACIIAGLGVLLLLIGLFFLEETPRSPWADESAKGSRPP